jgi:hypothetical protein
VPFLGRLLRKPPAPFESALVESFQSLAGEEPGWLGQPHPALEVMLRRLINDAMRSDPRAVKLLLSLVDRYEDSPETTLRLGDVLAEDQEILAQYLQEPAGLGQEADGKPDDEERGDDVLSPRPRSRLAQRFWSLCP